MNAAVPRRRGRPAGTAMLRYVIRTDPLTSAGVAEIIRSVSPAVQHHLSAPAL